MYELELKELVDHVYHALSNCKLIDVALYVAHRHLDRSIQQLSEQTGIQSDSINNRVDFIESQLFRHVQTYMQG